MPACDPADGSMIISPGRGYIFVHIPKTGGTSLSLALEARATKDDILIGDTPKAVRRRHRLKGLSAPGRIWKHSRLADIDGMVGLPDPAFVFTLVRNPWNRLVSLYYWARTQTFEHPLVLAAKTHPFHGFLKISHVEASLRGDGVASYVTDRAGRERCDAFVRLEHLTTDLAPVEAHLGFQIEMPHANMSSHPDPVKLYTPETIAFVADVFAEDIARFGYASPA